ncbi:MAG: BamA/TamA family outer membrane protein [Bacteroidota bacterium]
MIDTRYFLVLVLLLAGCATSKPYVAERYRDWQSKDAPPASELDYRVFLIGDAGGAPEGGTTPGLTLLKNQLDAAGEDAAVVFLGDNIYCCGLPDSAAENRAFAEHRLLAQLRAVEDFGGRVVFAPGNHDWNHSEPGGLEALARQEAYVEAYLGGKNVFRPDNGFPGPEVIKLTDRARLVVIDTEWWITPHEKGQGEYDNFDIEEKGDFLVALNEVVKEYDKEDLLVIGHHPIYSNSEHAGRFPLRTHIFPLTELAPKAYVPLPILGSLVPIFVRYIGFRQDIAHPTYRALTSSLLRVFGEHESIIYASGHDHNLQYFKDLHHDYIVSGGGSRTSYVARGGAASFTYETQGFSTLNYYKDGSIWMTMWAADEAGEGEVVFRKEIKGPARDAVDAEVPDNPDMVYPDYSDSTYVIAANPNYKANGLYEFLLGKHNRDIWALPVEVPYLDMGKVAGGLTPVKRGGGMQTFSLRLAGEDGFEYVIRSIDKDPSVSVPEELRQSFVAAIVQDQIASIHPYGAFIIPKLASAAGVYHTTPQLVYVPDDPRLGVYREKFGKQLMMFEIRPSDDMSNMQQFGNSEDVISATKFYQEIEDDNDNRLDAPAFAKVRLFDMLLSDWDRHKLQWRWAEFDDDDGKGKMYRPVPRDRDWAFNKFDGVMPALVRISFDPKFQEFDEDFGNLKGLSKNGHWQDRRLTATISRDTWIEKAAELQASLTDEVIDAAVQDWPASVVEYHGDEIAATLKVRRDKLHLVAEEYYEILARYVDIVGSNKHERFEVNRISEEETELIVYKTSKKGENRQELIRRTFYADETRELRLFGLGGNDHFELGGRVNTGILVRAIGGVGDDVFTDHSEILAGGNRAIFYDTRTSNEATAGPNTKVVFSNDPGINAYDQKDYLHDAKLPQVFFGRNQDDGIFVGGGMKFVKHGFRKKPFDRSQRIVGNFAALTQAFNLVYEGQFVNTLGQWDLGIDANYRSPNNFRNFFGLGNETVKDQDAEFFRAQLATALFAPSLELTDYAGTSIELGSFVRYVDVRNESDTFISQAGIDAGSFRDQVFFGLSSAATLDFTDHPANPKQGFLWANDAEVNIGLSNSDEVYSTLQSALSFYISPSTSPQVTLALRFGGAHNIGDFPFYAANTIGGRRTVRGWRSNRFAGRTSVYTNAEVRAKLFNVNSYVATGEFGLLGFYDNGRVWTEADTVTGRVWHQGYGGGIWISLFDAFVLNATMGFSEEDEIFDLKFGFLY